MIATDPFAEMLARCCVKGLEAYAMDFLTLTFPPRSFDAAYSFNSLLHVPNENLSAALDAVQAVLIPGGLFYDGVYGGEDFEGLRQDDWHDPPRFFCFRSDRELLRGVAPYFDVVDFRVVVLGSARFQALTMRVLHRT